MSACFDAKGVYDELLRSMPIATNLLPWDSRGIYALWDHEGIPRYIGIVDKESFHKRIDGRHRGGSEENSHKFSAAYNVGRMWRDRKRIGLSVNGAAQTSQGAAVAKRLRMEFIRRYCRATVFPVIAPTGLDYSHYVRSLESEVQRIADPEHRKWETQKLILMPEPTLLLDRLMHDLLGEGFLQTADIALLEAQREVCMGLRARMAL